MGQHADTHHVPKSQLFPFSCEAFASGESFEWMTVEYEHPEPAADDWVAVFSPAKFKYYQFANFKNEQYTKTGKGSLKFRLINQRYDFAFGLFSGGLSNVRMLEPRHHN
ncbi:hypothetical protein Taro_012251 [Colocasia esculenta]|uniref:Purple acid phosphatase Fn3-like domain-containing protein n=1 Tax=Colocasia esculenta TaxID=4460 RepID=A0A843U8I3_COLES|nr:hypothetical protein [Colocasia esculenta]